MPRISAPEHLTSDQKAEWYQERWDLISRFNSSGRRNAELSSDEASANGSSGKAPAGSREES